MTESDFARILRALIQRARQDEPSFVYDFSKKKYVDRRTAQGWLAQDSHAPQEENLKKLADYFQNVLPGLQTPMFRLSFDEFSKRIEAQGPKPAPVTLPFAPDTLRPGVIKYLTGTYRIYRYSLAGTIRRITCDVATIQPTTDNRVLNIDMLSTPASRAKKVEPTPADELEKFSGPLWKFGDIYLGMMFHQQEGMDDRRMRQIHFPVSHDGRTAHYGLVTGYSANLLEPAAARALMYKVSSEDTLQQECADGRLRPYRLDDPVVAKMLPLLDNHIEQDIHVLTVDHRRLIEGDEN